MHIVIGRTGFWHRGIFVRGGTPVFVTDEELPEYEGKKNYTIHKGVKMPDSPKSSDNKNTPESRHPGNQQVITGSSSEKPVTTEIIPAEPNVLKGPGTDGVVPSAAKPKTTKTTVSSKMPTAEEIAAQKAEA